MATKREVEIKELKFNSLSKELYNEALLNNEIKDDEIYLVPEDDESNISDSYNSTRTYAVGDYCIYEGVLFKCITAITTPETWDINKWKATNVATELKTKVSSTKITEIVVVSELPADAASHPTTFYLVTE